MDIAAGRGAITGPATDAVGNRGKVIAIDTAPKRLAASASDHPGRPQLGCRVMDAHQPSQARRPLAQPMRNPKGPARRTTTVGLLPRADQRHGCPK
ncbi:hypothetical protein HC362_03220 [Streptomyces sp. 891-h]|nr:hypothetical protein HC362_03220 [Streptomyces sp. 891-h]